LEFSTVQTDVNDRGGPSVLTGPIVRAYRPDARRAGTRVAALAVAESHPPVSQDQVLDRLGLRGNEFAEGIFARCGVDRRHLELSDEFLSLSTQGRTPQIEAGLFERSVAAIDALGIDPERIGTVISSSLYSLGCPSLAHRLVDHYAMSPSTDKYHLTGVGCASAVPLMKLATQAMRSHPDRQALVVGAESMSGILTRSREGDSKAKIVGSAIFGDGCAAALLSQDPRAQGPAIVAAEVHQLPGTLDAVRIHAVEDDSFLALARELPDLAGAGLPGVADDFLHRHHLRHEQIDHWIVHPGGRRIIENVQSALELTHDDVQTSWDALSDHGNVGTPSIFYVLKDTIERRNPSEGETGVMVTIGPGVTAGMMLLRW
jgi:alkylresorcinol/alkylpyrone synthase